MANVYTSLSNTIWYTDKCSISTGNTAVTYQVYATALGSALAEGNIYSGPPEIGANKRKQIYVGVGNYITVTGSNYTAQEIGAQTSAQAGTGNFTENLTPSGPVSIRSLLSPTGQTAYDAASSDAFFAVSQTDYDAVVAGVDSVSTVGPDNTTFTGISGSPFSANYLVTYPEANATVPASNYIIGFRAVTGISNSQWKIYGGPTFKSTSPAYSQISTTSPSTGAGAPGIGTFYYLRKAPAVQAANTYIGILGTQTLTMTANSGGWTGGGYASGAFTTWSTWTNNMPKVQVIITPTAVV